MMKRYTDEEMDGMLKYAAERFGADGAKLNLQLVQIELLNRLLDNKNGSKR